MIIYSVFLDDTVTLLHPDSTIDERLLAGFFLIPTPAKFAKPLLKHMDDVAGGVKGMGKGVKGIDEINKEITDVHNVKEAKDIIAERTKGLNIKEHPTTTKQMSSTKMKELKDKIDNRTITKQEYADYIWNKK